MGYTTDLTDTQWELIEEFFVVKKGKNLQQHNKRDLVNAVLYRKKTGCQWRLLSPTLQAGDARQSNLKRRPGTRRDYGGQKDYALRCQR